MTTEAAAQQYLAEHLARCKGKGWAVHNPHNKPLDELPVIYGFNNGGSTGCLSAVLLAEDGTVLGGHCCSAEGYMPHDLGVLEGSRPDRHETFREHYPDGYRMEFVGYDEVPTHAGIEAARQRNQEKAAAAKAEVDHD
jgi:hypothetical protein